MPEMKIPSHRDVCQRWARATQQIEEVRRGLRREIAVEGHEHASVDALLIQKVQLATRRRKEWGSGLRLEDDARVRIKSQDPRLAAAIVRRAACLLDDGGVAEMNAVEEADGEAHWPRNLLERGDIAEGLQASGLFALVALCTGMMCSRSCSLSIASIAGRVSAS